MVVEKIARRGDINLRQTLVGAYLVADSKGNEGEGLRPLPTPERKRERSQQGRRRPPGRHGLLRKLLADLLLSEKECKRAGKEFGPLLIGEVGLMEATTR